MAAATHDVQSSPQPSSLAGRTALVTGAAGGLGGALTLALSSRGAKVIACDVNTDGLSGLQSGEGSEGGTIHAQRMNLADPEDVQRGVEAILREHGSVDILIHTALRHFAGDDGNELREFANHSPAQVLETLGVSIIGPTLLTQLLCKGMIERWWGRIVLTGSMHRAGAAGLVMYTAAKSYINTLARALFLELRDYNVVTSVVNPGGMNTALHGYRYPWMLEPASVAELILDHLSLPERVAVLSFDVVPHDPEHPDLF